MAPLLTLEGGARSVPLLMSVSDAFSVPSYTLIKLCCTKALEWSSLVPGPEAKSWDITNLTSFTISYQFYGMSITRSPWKAFKEYLCISGRCVIVNESPVEQYPKLKHRLLLNLKSSSWYAAFKWFLTATLIVPGILEFGRKLVLFSCAKTVSLNDFNFWQ